MRERNESGKSIKEYCASIGIHQNVYYYWQRKLREAASRDLMPATVSKEEVTAPKGWAVCELAGNGAEDDKKAVSIEIGKSRITVSTDTDMELLRKVCQALTSIC
jgi:putative transposase